MPTISLSHDVAHFIDLVKRGRKPVASSGERAACRLAEAAAEYLPQLDAAARIGFAGLLEAIATAPSTARDVLEL